MQLLIAASLAIGITSVAAHAELSPQEAATSQLPDLGTRVTGDDWPAFLGPSGDGKSREIGILTSWPKAGPRVVWMQSLGTGYATPVISKGRLFQFDRFGDMARLTCMKSETGEFLWKFEYPTDYRDTYGYNNGPRCCPIADGDRVYLYGAEGMLHCVSALDGTLVWKVDTVKQFGVVPNFFGVGSAPLVERDVVIAVVGGSPPGSPEIHTGDVVGNGSAIVAFDKRTGKVLYAASDELAAYASPVAATIGGRRWGFVLARGGLIGFEPATGKIDFHYPWRAKLLESVNASNPVVVDDMVFISETYGPGSALLRVRPGGYEIVWADDVNRRDKSMQTHWNTPIHHQGYVYGSSGRHSQNAELRCIELRTGRVCWSQPDLGRCSLTYVDGHFLCLSEYGLLLLVKATHEKFVVSAGAHLRDEAGRPLIKYPAWAAPVLSHGLLYIRGDDRLVCLELMP